MTEKETKALEGVNTPYDDAFRTMVNDCTRLLIPVINEVFGKHYNGNEEIVFHANEHFLNQQDGSEDKRITDSSFSIIAEKEERYLLECQSRPDNSMLVRIFEYATQIALDEGAIVKNTLEVTIPNAAILFLRSTSKTPDEMNILMHTPGGDVQFAVHVMKMMNYTLDTIFEKELYFLLPFYIFTHEAKFASYEVDASKLEGLKGEYAWMIKKLGEALGEEKITYYYMKSIIEMAKLVLESIAKNYENVRKGVDSVMGGTILEHESKTIFNEGRNVGLEEGRNKGKMEEKETIAKRLSKAGMKDKDIAKYVDASIKLVRQWIGAPAPVKAKKKQ